MKIERINKLKWFTQDFSLEWIPCTSNCGKKIVTVHGLRGDAKTPLSTSLLARSMVGDWLTTWEQPRVSSSTGWEQQAPRNPLVLPPLGFNKVTWLHLLLTRDSIVGFIQVYSLVRFGLIGCSRVPKVLFLGKVHDATNYTWSKSRNPNWADN